MKTRYLLFIIFLLCSFRINAQSKTPIKVACIGNSITYGSGIPDRIRDAYPAQLGRMLGADYEVRNYGVSGRTMLNKGDHPYMSEEQFFGAVSWHPEVVIIKLGTNDSKPWNWQYKDEYVGDYLKLIEAFDTLPSHPRIYLAMAVPVFKTVWGISQEVVSKEVNPLILDIAQRTGHEVIDLFNPLINKGDLFPDHIHPNADGSREMAKIVYQSITGRKGQLTPQEWPGVQTEWKGYERYDFDFNGRNAFIKLPKESRSGRPWVWRARFPDWHTEMDELLLKDGFSIAYVNTDHMLGSPEAMEVWDQFYDYLTHIRGFNRKVVLEGVSRGGLFIYNWAKRHPSRVTCIYAEAPVCDISSWPGGYGVGKGSDETWNTLKKAYGFKSDAEARSYQGNPIDGLHALAKARVPILHMIGLKDKVVPVSENTSVLVERYISLGGNAQVIACTRGQEGSEGHHFEIETPQYGADFIAYFTDHPWPQLQSDRYHIYRSNLTKSFQQFENHKMGRVAFLGGSITYNGGWRDSVMQYLEHRFSGTQFDFIAAGIPSMGSTCGAFRMERDVLMNGQVDLLFVEAAVNDGGKGRSKQEIMRSMEGIVRHAKNHNPNIDIVFMYFVDPNKMDCYRGGVVPAVIQYHDSIAAYYNISAINLAQEVTERIDAGEFSWEDDFKNLHPSPFGQGIYAQSMIRFLEYMDKNKEPQYVDKISYSIPAPLDKYCYDHGRLIESKEAHLTDGWRWEPEWIPRDSSIWVRDNYHHVPMLIGAYPGEALSFNFLGTAVGIAVAAGPDAGIIEYSINGEPWKRQDLFTPHSKSYHLPWYYTLADGLINGNHELRIRLTQDKNPESIGRTARIRYFYTN